MLDIEDYTTLDSIRGVLGVTAKELTDVALREEVYGIGLEIDFKSASSTLLTDLDAAKVAGSGDADGVYFREIASIFATYSVAVQVTPALPLFSPKTITDGKAAISRHADSPYKETIKGLKQMFNRYKTELLSAQAAFGSTSATEVLPTFFGVAVPDTDPVVPS